MTDFDDRWLDVDFEQCPEFVFGDLGACTFGQPAFEQRFGTLDASEIEAAIDACEEAGGGLDQLVTRIYDQVQEGSCVANATCQAAEIIQAKERGKDAVVHLSAISLYKRIGRTAQSGAIVSDGWKELKARGVLPLDNEANRRDFAHVMPNTGFSRPFPTGWEETAKHFAGLEAWPINTVEGLFTALLEGHPCVVGRQGHAICYTRLMRDNRRRKIMKYANSWHESWGQEGFGFDSESQIREAARWAFAVRAMRGRQ